MVHVSGNGASQSKIVRDRELEKKYDEERKARKAERKARKEAKRLKRAKRKLHKSTFHLALLESAQERQQQAQQKGGGGAASATAMDFARQQLYGARLKRTDALQPTAGGKKRMGAVKAQFFAPKRV